MRAMLRMVLYVAMVFAVSSAYAESPARQIVDLAGIKMQAKNFIRNGDFETPGKPIPHWRRASNWSLDKTTRVSGNYSLRAVGSKAKATQAKQDELEFLRVGETYTLSAWMKSENLISIRPGDDSLGVKVVDAGWHWTTGIRPAAPTSDWRRYAVTFKAPPTKHFEKQGFHLRIYVPKNETGRLWVDNVQIERGAKATDFTAKAVPDLYRTANLLNEAYALLPGIRASLNRLAPTTAAIEKFRKEADSLHDHLTLAARRVQDFEKVSDEQWRETVSKAEEIPRKVRKMAWSAWWTNPWARYSSRQAPNTTKPAGQRIVRLAINDYVPLALMITNLTDRSQEIRARLLPAEGRYSAYMAPSWVTLRQARRVSPTYQPYASYPTLLAKLDNCHTIRAGSGETTQLWIDIDTAGIKPGSYPMKLELIPYSDLEPNTVPLVIEVVPVRLPEKCPAQVFCFGQNPINARSINARGFGIAQDPSQEEMDARNDPWLRDLVKHGLNRFMHHNQHFTPKFADNGSLAEPIDFTHHDRELASIRRYFDKLNSGYSVAHYHLPAVPNEDFERKFASLMKAWLGHLQKLGIDIADFPLELMDEPQGENLEKNRVAYRVLKEVIPEARTYAAISTRSAKGLRSIAPLMDIMVINPRVGEKAHAALHELQGQGKEIWTYICTATTLEKMYPYSYYRLLPWQTWFRGYSGFGFTWSMSGMNSPRDNWISPYYFGADGPVPSRGWQGFWRGTRDWAYLHTLRKRIKTAREAGNAEKADTAEKVLKQAVTDVVSNPDDLTRADYWREQILNQILALQ